MITVGIGEYAISEDLNETIITYALGSCIAFIIRCPSTKKTALAHIVLPEANINEGYRYIEGKPSYFADVIIPKLLKEFVVNHQCRLDQLQITIAGGADTMNPNDVFRVGKHNVEKVKQYIRHHDLRPINIDVGGTISRTVEVSVESGSVNIIRYNYIDRK